MLKSLRLNEEIRLFPSKDYKPKKGISRRERIRIQMMQSFLYGGKRAKYAWTNRWFGTGDTVTRGAVRWLGTALFGLQSLASKDVTWLLIFYGTYIPITIVLGFLYYWYDVQGIDAWVGMILDPFVYQVRKKLKIKDNEAI